MIMVLRRPKVHSFLLRLEGPVFLNPLSRARWPDVQDQRKLYFQPTLHALGIRRRHAYQTRHNFATLALMSGLNPTSIARQLGHSTTAMLIGAYGKWIDGGDGRREARKLNAAFRVADSELAHFQPTGVTRLQRHMQYNAAISES